MSHFVQPRQRDISQSFSVLKTEEGNRLLQENGAQILVGVSRTGGREEFEQNRELKEDQ